MTRIFLGFLVGLAAGVMLANLYGEPPRPSETHHSQGELNSALTQSAVDYTTTDAAETFSSIKNDESVSTPATNKTPVESDRATEANPQTQAEFTEPYWTMLTVERTLPYLSVPELFQRFQIDKRDESWAQAMESGMRQFVTESAQTYGITVDDFECRASYCLLTGVSINEDPQRLSDFQRDLRESGWWQAESASMITHSVGQLT